MVRPMVHSTKHYVQVSLQTVTASTIDTTDIVNAVSIDLVNTVSEVAEGSSIKAVWMEMWIRTQSTSPGSFVAILYKNQGGGSNVTTTEIAALGAYDNKKNVLYTTQGLTNDQDADAVAIYKGWIKIPKSKQRFGLGDKLQFSIFAQGALDLTQCGFFTYKSYS